MFYFHDWYESLRLFSMQAPVYYFVNSITFYRLIAAPLMVLFIFNGNFELFKWLLPISFFTDLIDGYLARTFKVSSVFGSMLDSIADDLTIVAAVIGVFVFKSDFIRGHLFIVILMLSLLVIQNIYSLIKYKKLSSFHTYLAKAAAILQGSFLILLFLLPQPLYWLFYAASIVTILDLIEEIILVKMFPKWVADVKGLYWVLKKKK